MVCLRSVVSPESFGPRDYSKSLSGEVKEGKVYICQTEESKVLDTLRHEIIDYQITSEIIQHLIDITNLSIESKEGKNLPRERRYIEHFLELFDQNS